MDFLIVVALLAAASLAFAHFMKTSVAASLPVAAFSFILVTYLFGLFNLLFIGVLVSVAMALVALVLALIKSNKSGSAKNLMGQLVSPGAMIFWVLITLSYSLTRAMQFHSWDEFSHWGTVAKAFFIFDSLSPYNPADLAFRSYPPAISIFQYLVNKVSFGWFEGNVFWAYQILIFAALVPFAAKLSWKKPLAVVIAGVSFLVVPLMFFASYSQVYVDPILGILFGYALSIVAISDLRLWSSKLQLSLGLAVLILSKDSGLFLAAVVLVYYLIRMIQLGQLALTNLKRPTGLLGLLSPILAVVAASLSWSTLLSAQKIQKAFSQPLEAAGILDAFSGGGPEYFEQIRQNFGQAFLTKPLGETLSSIAAVIIFALALSAMFRLKVRDDETRLGFAPAATILVSGLVYTVGLMVLYFFRFGEYEAVNLASFSRYLGTFWAGVAVFVTAVLVAAMAQQQDKKLLVASSAVWLIFAMAVAPISNFFTLAANPGASSQQLRAQFAPLAQQAEIAGISKGSKVWIIAQHTSGFEYWIYRYMILQAHANQGSWSIGEKSGDGDMWTTQMKRDEWASQLRDYDFVVFLAANDGFMAEFGSLFTDKNQLNSTNTFRVIKIGDTVSLEAAN